MLNFAVGPVMMDEETLSLGAEQIPYFRTSDFSNIMLENERSIKHLADAPEDARVIFLTSSGSGAMEAVVTNLLTKHDHALVINGGSFGQRFADICSIHQIPFTQLKLAPGQGLTEECLYRQTGNFTALLVNHCETSTGVSYDLSMIHRFCKKHGLLFIVDAISSFLADRLSMSEWEIDALITGSQKALALPPGIAISILGAHAIARVEENPVPSLYFNFKAYLKDGLRGQTPFTPAVAILLQLHHRLSLLEGAGIHAEYERIKNLADDFRDRIHNIPLEIATPHLSNCVTPLKVASGISAHNIFEILRDEYQIFVCPNGGELQNSQFRVGHIGALTIADNEILLNAFHDLCRRGLL